MAQLCLPFSPLTHCLTYDTVFACRCAWATSQRCFTALVLSCSPLSAVRLTHESGHSQSLYFMNRWECPDKYSPFHLNTQSKLMKNGRFWWTLLFGEMSVIFHFFLLQLWPLGQPLQPWPDGSYCGYSKYIFRPGYAKVQNKFYFPYKLP